MSEIPALKQIIEGAILAADQPLSIDLMIHLFEHEPPTVQRFAKLWRQLRRNVTAKVLN